MKNNKWFTRILFIFGFLICAYPMISSYCENMLQTGMVHTYQNEVKKISKADVENAIADAHLYNNKLFEKQSIYIGNTNDKILSDKNYEKLLNLSNTGIMASIEIPKISVNLPIYHGTSDDVLSNGIGHYQSSSLPVGGKNTRCMLTGHRGLANAKLFTRLDEIVENDLFFINVLGDTLAYQVFDVEVLEPDDVRLLNIEKDQDLVTLITCTPYGLNTHRLVITGKRVPYKESTQKTIQPQMMSPRETLFTCLPILILLLTLLKFLINKKRELNRQ